MEFHTRTYHPHIHFPSSEVTSPVSVLFILKRTQRIQDPMTPDTGDSSPYTCGGRKWLPRSPWRVTLFEEQNSPRYAKFPSLDTYLKKVISTINQIDVLCSALWPPQCSELFTLPFSVKTLPAVSTNIHPAPTKNHGWERALERVVDQEYHWYKLDQGVIRKGSQFIATEAVSASKSVHCELQIALEMMENGN